MQRRNILNQRDFRPRINSRRVRARRFSRPGVELLADVSDSMVDAKRTDALFALSIERLDLLQTSTRSFVPDCNNRRARTQPESRDGKKRASSSTIVSTNNRRPVYGRVKIKNISWFRSLRCGCEKVSFEPICRVTA